MRIRCPFELPEPRAHVGLGALPACVLPTVTRGALLVYSVGRGQNESFGRLCGMYRRPARRAGLVRICVCEVWSVAASLGYPPEQARGLEMLPAALGDGAVIDCLLRAIRLQ